MIRDKALEVSGTTNTTSQAYRDAIGEELKQTGLDTINKADRSYLLKIMDNLEEVEAWLAKRTNLDRLNHPKTIWKAFNRYTAWLDDPGVDWEDAEEYWGNDPEEREEVDCAACGRKTAEFAVRKDGSYFCSECNKANPEKDDDKGKGKDDHEAGAAGNEDHGAGGDDAAREGKGGNDHDAGGDDHEAGEDHLDGLGGGDDADGDYGGMGGINAGKDRPRKVPGMHHQIVHTVGQLGRYISDAKRQGAKYGNRVFVKVGNEDDLRPATVYFLNEEGDKPPVMIIWTEGNTGEK
jgi:hypothetical protein